MFVRWDSLRVDAEAERRLPGYREPAVVRTFDAPEALDVRFYEVHAKSALKQVPKASRMPFQWTINPYRGCTHACTYCTSGDTPILTADGRTKPLADLRVGDGIYGTVRSGRYRRYAITTVRAHCSTVKQAYRTSLDDGTALITSGDHRFLSDRGWKYVTGAQSGPMQRPHLTPSDDLVGTARFPAAPEATEEYRRGYLCGLIRGDAHLGSRDYAPPDRAVHQLHRFRLALVDMDALWRARRYLRDFDVATDEFVFQKAAEGRRAMGAIRTQAQDRVARIKEIVAWPRQSSDGWRKGFLAGIYDAEGGYNGGILRVHNTDEEIIDWTTWCLRRLDFDVAVEDRRLPNGLRTVRIRGGVPEHLRFFLLVDPAITRKRSIAGTAIKTDVTRRVVSVEPLGMEMLLYDLTTGTGDFVSNGVISHNCFARPTHTYLDMDAGRDFEREIVVKVNLPEVLRAELRRPSWKREHVALGTNTDPYQWVESRYRLMPEVWEALRDSGTPCSVLTKSPLLLRDIGLFKELAARGGFTANLSIPTLDEKAWRATEPHTPHPRKRLEAVAELNRAGVPTGVLVAPLMPGINDAPEQVEPILEACSAAGATHIGGVALHLRGEVRGIFFDWLRAHRPDLVPRYEQLYSRGAYAPPNERERLARMVRRDSPAEAVSGRLTPAGTIDRDPAPAPDTRASSREPDSSGPLRRPSPRREGLIQESLF